MIVQSVFWVYLSIDGRRAATPRFSTGEREGCAASASLPDGLCSNPGLGFLLPQLTPLVCLIGCSRPTSGDRLVCRGQGRRRFPCLLERPVNLCLKSNFGPL